jgi:hypothetical protein
MRLLSLCLLQRIKSDSEHPGNRAAEKEIVYSLDLRPALWPKRESRTKEEFLVRGILKQKLTRDYLRDK